MPKFAVYYVPPADDDLYRVGASFVGYDVRRRRRVDFCPGFRKLPGFTEEWVDKARQYGFHLTIGDAIDFMPGDLPKIERMVADIVACLAPGHTPALAKPSGEFVRFWRCSAVICYDPNEHLRTLHTLITSCVNPLGTGSGYLKRHLEKTCVQTEPHKIKRTQLFYSPTVFDSYQPHFTVVDPCPGPQDRPPELAQAIARNFERFTAIRLTSICLLTQMNGGEDWTVLREFDLP